MAETYHGKPCKVCGGTERLRSNRACVHDRRNDHLEERGALERKRELNREWMREWSREKRRTDPEWVAQVRRNGQTYKRRKAAARVKDYIEANYGTE